MGWNWAVREAGRIRAVVGSFPIEWQLGDTRLAMAGIGGVSSHPRRRGAGYMRQLMHHCVARMHDECKHLSWLGGQRQRYAYFGYEKCGIGHSFTVSKTNLRHAYGDATSRLVFQPLDAADQTHRAGCIVSCMTRNRIAVNARPSALTSSCAVGKTNRILPRSGRAYGRLPRGQRKRRFSDRDPCRIRGQPLSRSRSMDGPAERQQHAFRHASVASSGSPTRPPAPESVSTSYTGNWQVFKNGRRHQQALLDVRAAIGLWSTDASV